MTTQYTVDLGAAAGFNPAQTQALLNILNPSLGALSSAALDAFEQQLTDLGTGKVGINSVTLDSASTPGHTLFDFNITGKPHEILHAGAGHDTIKGAAGDTIYGSTSSSGGALLIAGSGKEVLYAGAGSDTLRAGSGRDPFFGDAGNGEHFGPKPHYRVGEEEIERYWREPAAGRGRDEAHDANCEHDTQSGGASNVTMYGSTAPTGHALLIGGAGNSVLNGGVGSDTLYGGSGLSTLNAGYGHETMYGGAGLTVFVFDKAHFVNNDVIHGGRGLSILDLADFSGSDVSVNKNVLTGVTTVAFNGHSLTLNDITAVAFKDGVPHKM
jgi:Ca2+-binding RTX toxin-like protein